MTIFIDYKTKTCFILSPKCGTQTISKYLELPINKVYSENEIINVLKDNDFKKIIVVRDILSRFYSGFIEDLNNNKCYEDIDISFYQYVKFINFCYVNKIKNVNNLNSYFTDKDKLIEWGNCSFTHLPITDSDGELSGHIIHQKPHLEPYILLLEETDNVEVIDISQLNKFTNIYENSKVYKNFSINKYNCNILLKDLKQLLVYPRKDIMINDEITTIINNIYKRDIEYIDYLKKRFNSKVYDSNKLCNKLML